MALDWYRYSLPIQTIDELLEEAHYTNMTRKELTNHQVRQRNPYQKMLYILEEAYTNQEHSGAFCD